MISALFAGIYGHFSRTLLLALLLGSLTARSASAKGDAAEQHYSRGLAYYESKDYPKAIREFQAAYKIRQLPRILLNIGQVYRKLGMASTALRFYEHYLRVDPKPKPEIKAEVDRYIAMTRAMLDPPAFEEADAKSAKAAAAAAVAAAPSNVTPVAVSVADPFDIDPLSKPTEGSKSHGAKTPGDKTGADKTNSAAAHSQGSSPTASPGVTGVNTAAPPSATPELKSILPTATGSEANQALTQAPPIDKSTQKPFYKQPLFWGVVGGVAAAVTITAIAVGVSQSNGVPATVLYPTK